MHYVLIHAYCIDLMHYVHGGGPAGMYHGRCSEWYTPEHGGLISLEALRDGCVNAGLLRLDPPPQAERHALVSEMVAEAMSIPAQEASNLPEQYYLVNKLSGWHHVSVQWNCEVVPYFYVEEASADSPSRIERSRMAIAWHQLGNNQDELREKVGMFHFSGRALHPWWYLSFSPEEATAHLNQAFCARDPRGLTSLAVSEWLTAAEELKETAKTWPEENAAVVAEVLGCLTDWAEAWWKHAKACPSCGLPVSEGWATSSAEATSADAEGWVCEECVVGRLTATVAENYLLPA